MVFKTETIRFILNQTVVNAVVHPGVLALDYVRQVSQLMGTKQGCKEGDCGACNVIVGELDADGLVQYKPVTSCLLPMGELMGKHLVTIEGLNGPELSQVQSAMVECGGSQCGYCTPGFVVAMTAGLMAPKLPLNQEGLMYAISGNLCRCTGYRSIKEAGMQAIDALADKLEGKERVQALCAEGALPEYFLEIPERLKALKAQSATDSAEVDFNDATFISGGTDWYVQKGEAVPDVKLALLNTVKPVAAAVERDGYIVVDARMTSEGFADDPLIQSYLTAIDAYNLLIASWPVRTRATIGGNICNASPIADTTCLMLALDSELVIGKGGKERIVPLKDFYLGYKQLNKEADERLLAIRFPKFGPETKVNWEKVSKRRWLDISTVNSAIKLEMAGDTVAKASLALGGVAATPLFLNEASAFLTGKTLSFDVIMGMLDVAMTEFTPIGDVRGSARYKRLLARQLMLAHFSKLYPEIFGEEATYAALR